MAIPAKAIDTSNIEINVKAIIQIYYNLQSYIIL